MAHSFLRELQPQAKMFLVLILSAAAVEKLLSC